MTTSTSTPNLNRSVFLIAARCLRAPALLTFFTISFFLATLGRAADAPIVTRWAKSVTPDNCWREYPRPQLKRNDWLNLNGMWDIAIVPADQPQPNEFSRQILVPFPIESHLGGLRGTLTPQDKAWYRRTFRLPENWKSQRSLLHFGAVDWSTQVWVNGHPVGSHQGGYDPFSIDVSDALNADGENEIVVAVVDPTDRGFQPRGKQKLKPEGIWYTPVSGIWQTVWLEPVPKSSIESLKITPDVGSSSVTIEVAGRGGSGGEVVEISALDGSDKVASISGPIGKPLALSIPKPKLWSPDAPFLYGLQIRLLDGSQQLDEVESYFGLRTVSLGPDKNGMTRIMLNGNPVFQFGALDQGYWPDGLYTAPSDEAMKNDLEVAKRLGFNMLRKHVKVEPARWYYWCDKLGILVWQDMPSGDQPASWPADGTEINRSPVSAEQYWQELAALVDFCRNSPSVIVWIPFNEAWGQFDTQGVADWVKGRDPSRLVIAASGGNDLGSGDVDDDHFYPGPGCPPAEKRRAAVLGEFGGFGLPLPGHTWQDEASWSYRSFRNPDELTQAYLEALNNLRPLIESHLSAAVFTQITDVEIEVNGLMTYDREVVKLDEMVARAASEGLRGPLPKLSDAARIAASTIAWWRFEDLEPGTPLPDIAGLMGAIAARDASGHNNHLYAFSPSSAPSEGRATYLARLKDASLQNKTCLDDTVATIPGAPVRDLFTEPYLSRTHMDLLNTYPFSQWTVEASFCVAKTGNDQVLVAKGGHVPNAADPGFQLGIFGKEGWIEAQVLDQSGKLCTVRSQLPVQAGKWYHVAAMSDGEHLRLYVRPDDQPDYALQGEAQMSGAMKRGDGTWIVGRGYEGASMADDFCGAMDEVRISTVARPPSDLLFAQ
jgi:Glycosyl hydrolases family 2, sugar binding domain/Concanavalin A-like lectin/glucanases superfamily/Glycosyl hydrolases family 2/Glycosyl hydrolases family 2, TIM barrel domain